MKELLAKQIARWLSEPYKIGKVGAKGARVSKEDRKDISWETEAGIGSWFWQGLNVADLLAAQR